MSATKCPFKIENPTSKIQEYTSRVLKAPGYISSFVILRFLNLSFILNYQPIIFAIILITSTLLPV